MSWLDDVEARIAAAKLIVDDETRVALWRLVLDARRRNHGEAELVSEWLLGCDLCEPADEDEIESAAAS
jgi:hypothetical protein